MKKLNACEIKFLKDILHHNDALIEMNNKRYYLSLVEEPAISVQKKDICQDVKEKYYQQRKDLLSGKDFSIDDIFEMMEHGIL
ncbi:hypothetical protein ACFFIS_17380 [Virgibacillus soli]|uniref:Uncharacterized protein n=1 Tax=Paracerasibacillus soli TaxID=480284 RepID=A0ABU5CUH6_9BACI|nr:hypothetical protein [Virgibacillus soli]MDY0409090.1 hypothetical protein [Virgibacillus soli]